MASTTATTASLASRIQSLAVDFGPKLHSEHISEGFTEEEHQEDEETDHENEEVIEIPEEQLLQELDRLEPAFQVFDPCISLDFAEHRCWSFDLTWYMLAQVCSRLFKDCTSSAVVLKRITYDQARSFQQRG